MLSSNAFIEANLDLDFMAAGTTTRGLDVEAAVSNKPYQRFNLGLHMQDDTHSVTTNRKLLQQHLPLPTAPCWLQQVHGTEIIEQPQQSSQTPIADASFTHQQQTVLAILTADCLPVVLASEKADWIAVAHCGWRSLAAGILSKTLSTAPQNPDKIRVWLGPAIGPSAFEVGEAVKFAFYQNLQHSVSKSQLKACFIDKENSKYLANLPELAKLELSNLGVNWIKGGDLCSYSDEARFYSYRRDGETGRMATLAWIK